MAKREIRGRARKSEYLLDTSALRSLTIDEIERLHKRRAIASFKASYLLPIEILSGTLASGNADADKQNKFRKAALNKYYHLIRLGGTEWEDEHSVIARAFGGKQLGTPKLDIALLIKACVDSKRMDDVIGRSPIAANLLEQLRRADVFTVDGFRKGLETIEQGNQENPEYTEEQYVRTYVFILFSELSQAFTNPPIPPELMTNEQLKELERQRRLNYDGSLDLIMDIWTAYWKELRTRERPIGKKIYNDAFDLKHVLYLRKDSKEQFFVTEDRNLYRLLKKVAPDRVLNKKEFLKHVLG